MTSELYMPDAEIISELRTLAHKADRILGNYAPYFENLMELAANRLEGKWIPVMAGFPEDEEEVLCYTSDNFMVVGRHQKTDAEWKCDSDIYADDSEHYIVAWQPLPEPYEVKRNE